MSEDLMLKCLIAFILGWLVNRMMGNGFRVGGQTFSIECHDDYEICLDNCLDKGEKCAKDCGNVYDSCSASWTPPPPSLPPSPCDKLNHYDVKFTEVKRRDGIKQWADSTEKTGGTNFCGIQGNVFNACGNGWDGPYGNAMCPYGNCYYNYDGKARKSQLCFPPQ